MKPNTLNYTRLLAAFVAYINNSIYTNPDGTTETGLTAEVKTDETGRGYIEVKQEGSPIVIGMTPIENQLPGVQYSGRLHSISWIVVDLDRPDMTRNTLEEGPGFRSAVDFLLTEVWG